MGFRYTREEILRFAPDASSAKSGQAGLLSGGLILTKTVESESTRTTTTTDPFVLLHRRDGGQRDVIIYGSRIGYGFLGAAMQPTSAANFGVLLARLGSWAADVTIDERATDPGFADGIPVAPTARIDVAMWLVWLAHLRQSV